MFRTAYSIASQFTRPVVLSRRTVNGVCSGGLGAYVVVNSDGWIVTAAHIVKQLTDGVDDAAKTSAFDSEREAIKNDTTLTFKERQKKIRQLHWPDEKSTRNFSAWWARDGVAVTDIMLAPAIDLAVARLEPFDPAWCTAYPTFKDPAKDFMPGVSLCKLGYPLNEVKPTWNEAEQKFELAVAQYPLFPIEGMFTRVLFVSPDGKTIDPALFMVETSTPGLRGQSGGPTFDSQGTIWALQVQTGSYPLGFNLKGHPEQFLHTGHGVSAFSMLTVFDQLGIKYAKSTY